MSSAATVTIRELKNKDTGIDLSVTSFKATKNMLGSTFEYQVMVVTNLPYFKSAKHKDAANVQFTVMKKLSEFDDLNTKMNTKYSGTVFPTLPKKVLMMSEAVARERRNNFDHYLKFLASTPKLCNDANLLIFLGVSSLKANSGKLRNMVVSDKKVDESGDDTDKNTNTSQTDGPTEEEEEENLFDDDIGAQSDDDEDDDDDDDDDLFPATNVSSRKAETKIFEDQDLSGALEEGEGQDLFIEGSKSNVTEVTKVKSTVEENVEELFSSDDELDKIMDMKLTQPATPSATDPDQTELTQPDKAESTQLTVTVTDDIDNETVESSVNTETAVKTAKPSITKPKPALKTKPTVPKRGEHVKLTKDSAKNLDSSVLDNNSVNKTQSKPKPPLKQKPTLAKKPELKPKPGVKIEVSDTTEKGDKTADNEDLTQDDIMKYIQENVTSNDDDLDLFS